MAYVLDYSSFYWQRKASLRRVAAASVVAVLLAAVGFGLWVRAVSLRPTFADVVTRGYAPRGETERVEPLETTAVRIYAVSDAWNELRDDYLAWARYLRLVWVPSGAAFTNALDAVASIASAPDLPRADSQAGPAMAPDSAMIRFRPAKDGDLVHSDASISDARPLSFGVKWRTLAPFGEEKGAEIRAFATNAVALAARPWAPSNAPSAAVLKFADGGMAGESVDASWTLPGAPLLPVSPQLDSVVAALANMSAELRKMKLGASKSGGEEKSVENLKLKLDARNRARQEKMIREYERSLDPGEWMRQRFDPSAFDFQSRDVAAEFYRLWQVATTGRLPWERKMDSFMRGSNFVEAVALRAFQARMPKVDDIKASRRSLDDKVCGLTNAIRAALFDPFDATPGERRAPEHETVNLLALGAETGVLPPGVPPVPALPGDADQRFTVRFPTAANPGGRHLVVAGRPDRTSRCAFAAWHYGFSSTNAPVAVSAVADGLRCFFGAGWGYEPESAEIRFSGDGGVVRFEMDGIVPVLLDGAAPGAQPDAATFGKAGK